MNLCSAGVPVIPCCSSSSTVALPVDPVPAAPVPPAAETPVIPAIINKPFLALILPSNSFSAKFFFAFSNSTFSSSYVCLNLAILRSYRINSKRSTTPPYEPKPRRSKFNLESSGNSPVALLCIVPVSLMPSEITTLSNEPVAEKNVRANESVFNNSCGNFAFSFVTVSIKSSGVSRTCNLPILYTANSYGSFKWRLR